jgi:hypothetical protein
VDITNKVIDLLQAENATQEQVLNVGVALTSAVVQMNDTLKEQGQLTMTNGTIDIEITPSVKGTLND